MVSILPRKLTPWQFIGQAMSQFGQNAPQLLEERFRTQRGLNAIDQLQKDLESAKGNPALMLPALMKAQTLNPTLERSGLASKALELAGAAQFPGALTEGAEGGAGQPPESTQKGMTSGIVPGGIQEPSLDQISAETQQAQPPTAQKLPEKGASIDSIANQYIAEVRPDLVNPATEFGAINTFNSAIKQDLTPQEEGRLRQQLFDKYKNPSVVNPVIDRIREGIKNRYNESLAKYGFDKDRLSQIQTKWDNFVSNAPKVVDPIIGKYGSDFSGTQQNLRNKYFQYAGDLPTNMTAEQMHANTMALLQNDMNKIDALHALPSMPPFRTESGVKDYLDTNRSVYKDLADMGYIDALREDAFLNKDMGNEEFHSLLWGDKTSKPFLNSLHALKAPEEYSRPVKGHPQITRYNEGYPKEHDRYINDLSKKLQKMSPTDDLVLSRAMVLDAGGDIKDFNQALSKAQSDGLKLSEFQRSQLAETTIPRRPPLWELFRRDEGKPHGFFEFLNWGPFINYLRGKK